MATSVVAKDQVNQYLHKLTVSIISQNPEANTTRVKYVYTVTRSGVAANGAWTFLNNVTFKSIINGVTHTATPNFDFRAQATYTMMSGEQTITHDATGAKNITVRLQGTDVPGSDYFKDADSGNVGFTLTPLNRGSDFELVPPSVIEGGTTTVTIHPSNPAYTHTVDWASGAASGVIGTGVATTIDYTPDPALLGGNSSVGITVTVTTFNGATQIGDPISHDLLFRTPPVYPEVGLGTPYDLRFRRTEMVGGNWVIKEQIPFIKATTTDTMSATGSCTIEVPQSLYPTDLDEAVVVADVYDGSQWISGSLVYYLSRSEGDTTDLTQTVTYTGTSFGDFLLSKAIVNNEPKEINRNAGYFMQVYFDAAKARGWAPKFVRSFNSTKTSAETAWKNTTDLDVSRDTPVSQILDGLVSDVLAEYRTRFNFANNTLVLDLFNPGYGQDWTTASADPVVNLSTAALFKVADKAPVRKDSADKITRVFVRGEGKYTATRESSTNLNPLFGHLEGTIDAAGVKSTARLNTLGDAVLKQNKVATVERTFSYDLSSTQTPTQLFPYRTFRPGDWVLIPGDSGLERARVSQIAITRDADGTKATITVGDLIPSGVAATARKLAQTGGGAISGGTLGGTPAPLSSTIPAAATGLSYVADGYWDPTGAPKASVTLSWGEVTTSLEGNSLEIDLYEVWTRSALGQPWVLALLSDTESATITGLNINQTFDVQIRARTGDGVYGEWSDGLAVTTPVPDELLPAPSNPFLEVDALGTVTVRWNGLLGGEAPPLWFSYLQAEISDSEFGAYSVAGQQLASAGDIAIPNVGAGTWWFRLAGFDTLNRRGGNSGAVSILVVPLAIDTREPKAPTDVVATSEGYWDGAAAQSSVTVSWTPVTEGIDGDPIDIRLYDVWGKFSADTTYRSIGETEDPEIVINPIGPFGSTWDIVVRAVGTNNELSAFSDPASVVIEAPEMNLFAPTTPSLNSAQGLLLVDWDGKLVDLGADPLDDDDDVVVDAPSYLSTVDIQICVDEGETWINTGFITRGDRTQSVGGLGVGSEVWVRLIAYDILGQASAPSGYAVITIVGIDGDDILAGTIGANQITAGSINVSHVSPSFGNDLDITANGTVTIIAGQASLAQAAADANTGNLAALRTRYDFTPSEAVISQPGSAFQVAISNTQLEFRESGVARAFLNAGVFTAPRMAAKSLVLQYQVIQDDPDGTVIRRL